VTMAGMPRLAESGWVKSVLLPFAKRQGA
jgi:hypothetical protein